MLYNATLRVELSGRLGVAWEPVDRNGQADIDGVPQALLEQFSKRRQEVERRATQRIAAAGGQAGADVDGRRAGRAVPVRRLRHPPGQARPRRRRGDPRRTVADRGGHRRMGSRPGCRTRSDRLCPARVAGGRRPGGGGRGRGRAGRGPLNLEPGRCRQGRRPPHPARAGCATPRPAGPGSRRPPSRCSPTPRWSPSLRRCRPRCRTACGAGTDCRPRTARAPATPPGRRWPGKAGPRSGRRGRHAGVAVAALPPSSGRRNDTVWGPTRRRRCGGSATAVSGSCAWSARPGRARAG